MKRERDRSEVGRILADIDQQIGELQRVRQILVDVRGWKDVSRTVTDGIAAAQGAPRRRRRTKAELLQSVEEQAS